MSYQPAENEAVIMESRMFDRMTVASVVGVTAKMVEVQHLDRYGTLVTSDTQRRKIEAVKGRLRPDLTMSEAQTELNEAWETLLAEEKAAKARYAATVQSLIDAT